MGAPLDVVVPAQNTGMGPEKTSFFQALQIPTKITKGTIEITSDVHLITAGDKVGMSEATLLNMLKISPFTYGLVVQSLRRKMMTWDSVFSTRLHTNLDITLEILLIWDCHDLPTCSHLLYPRKLVLRSD